MSRHWSPATQVPATFEFSDRIQRSCDRAHASGRSTAEFSLFRADQLPVRGSCASKSALSVQASRSSLRDASIFLQARNCLEALAGLVQPPARPSHRPRNRIFSELIETSSADAIGSKTKCPACVDESSSCCAALLRWANKKTFGCGALFLLLQPKNAFFHRDCRAFSGLAAQIKEYLRFERAGMSNLDQQSSGATA